MCIACISNNCFVLLIVNLVFHSVGKLMYVQTNINSSWDTFHFTLSDKQNILTGQHINITVKARITQHEPAILRGEQLILSKNLLDASDLAGLTNSDPLFTITKAPKHGDLLMAVRPTRRLRGATR